MSTKRVFALVTLVAALAFAQESPIFADETAPLTNALVVEMFEAGLSTEVIVNQIEQADKTDFDLETSSLIALRRQGIPSEVIAAMQCASRRSQYPLRRQNVAMARGSVTLIAGGERHRMYAAKMAGQKLTGGGAWVPFAPTKVKTKIAGSHARLRIKDSVPAFDVSIPASSHPKDSIVLVRVKAKKDVRLVTTGKVQGFGSTSMIPRKDRIPLGFEPTPAASPSGGGYQTYHAVVEEPLAAGEYVIVVEYQYFDFGIDL